MVDAAGKDLSVRVTAVPVAATAATAHECTLSCIRAAVPPVAVAVPAEAAASRSSASCSASRATMSAMVHGSRAWITCTALGTQSTITVMTRSRRADTSAWRRS